MDLNRFFLILVVGIGLVVVQGIFASNDGYLTQEQMRQRGVTNGWSFLEHGGMWSDVFIISPIVAYFASKYELHYFSMSGLIVLAIAVVISLVALYMYQKGGTTTPEAHTHDDQTTIAGWIHGLFAVAAMWICGLVYLGLTTPAVSRFDLILISLLLTGFFDLGVRKFSNRWKYDQAAKWQVAIEIIGLWILTFIRLY